MAIPKAKVDIVANDKTQRAFASVNRGLKNVEGQTKRVMTGFKALTGVFGAGFLLGEIKQAVDFGSALTDVSSRLSIGVEELQALQEASTRAGVSNDILERSLRNIKGRVQEAADGNKRYQESIERLGLDTDKLIRMPLERRLEAFGLAYRGATNQSEAFRDIQNILGEKAGPQLIEVLDRLAREGFDSVSDSAKKSGQVLSEDFAVAMDDAADALEKFNKQKFVFLSGVAERFLKVQEGKGAEVMRRDIASFMLSTFGGMEIPDAQQLARELVDPGSLGAKANIKAMDDLLNLFRDTKKKIEKEGLFIKTDLIIEKSMFEAEMEKIAQMEKDKDDPVIEKERQKDMLTTTFAGLGKKVQEDIARKAVEQRNRQIELLEEIGVNTAGGAVLG